MKTAEIREVVIQRILASLKKGVKPWKCPWVKSNEPVIPYNGKTKQNYSGVNLLTLWIEAEEKGYSKNAWMTLKQCNQLGGRILKGEKSTPGFFYSMLEKEVEVSGEAEVRKIPILKHFSLFNWDQAEGLHQPEPPLYERLQTLPMSFVMDYVAHQNIPLITKGDVACYIPMLDRIQMPETEFDCHDTYIATCLHEASHSTGHKSRLGRFAKFEKQLKDKAKVTAVEELCAELSAAILTASLGLHGEHLQHENYIGSWIKHLGDEPQLFFKAASEASRSATYIEFCVKQMYQHEAQAS